MPRSSMATTPSTAVCRMACARASLSAEPRLSLLVDYDEVVMLLVPLPFSDLQLLQRDL